MTRDQVLNAMKAGASLHMGHNEDGEQVFWLEPNRRRIRRDTALNVIGGGSVMAERDALFDGAMPQTWKAASLTGDAA